jgi:hypothetical protein
MMCTDVHRRPVYFAERGIIFVLLIPQQRARSQQHRFPIPRTPAVASQIRQHLSASSGSLGRDIEEKGRAKFQKTVFSANHEANDCDFRLFITEWDKLHLCGKVQVDDGDIKPSHA